MLLACLYVHSVCVVPKEARSGGGGKGVYPELELLLYAAIWVLGTEPGPP